MTVAQRGRLLKYIIFAVPNGVRALPWVYERVTLGAINRPQGHFMHNRLPLLAGATLLALPTALPAHAATIGSSNPIVIQDPVRVPDETPCDVPLVAGAVFGANNANFSYTPPAACPGPWAKVVLKVDVSVQAGIQYDRTGTLWLGGVPLWFGTTSEPSPGMAPHWEFKRDVTDYTTLFKTSQTGFELIANYTNSTDTSLLMSSADLLFYPATPANPAPVTPDLVLPFSSPGGGTVALGTPSDTLTTTVTLPQNVSHATLSLYLQGQSSDEFWYSCGPSSLSGELEGNCGGGAFREGEVTLDGTPAGVAPVYPWIFTGGFDPYLWFPLPGIQTLNFKPFNVPLTPFAGVLSNGSPHTIGLSIFGADSYFSVAGVLLVSLDPNATTVTGGITSNTLAASPTVTITPNLTETSSAVKGTIDTKAAHEFTITGAFITSAGKIVSTVHEKTAFKNHQFYHLTDSLYEENLTETTNTVVDEITTTPDGNHETSTTYLYPLTASQSFIENAQGNGGLYTTIDQQLQVTSSGLSNGKTTSSDETQAAVMTTDELVLMGGNFTSNANQATTESLLVKGTGKPCFAETFTAAANALTSATTGCGN
jgi:hypothetical protein